MVGEGEERRETKGLDERVGSLGRRGREGEKGREEG